MTASSERRKNHARTLVTAAIVVGMFLFLRLYLVLNRYYDAQELEALVDGANTRGESYSVVIHSGLTGSYSFNLD